ncbi:MAG: hypothetical protein ACRDSR_10565 [Pseudonocardiaceae bacterium]
MLGAEVSDGLLVQFLGEADGVGEQGSLSLTEAASRAEQEAMRATRCPERFGSSGMQCGSVRAQQPDTLGVAIDIRPDLQESVRR